MKIKNRPNFLKILQTCQTCGCEYYINSKDVQHDNYDKLFSYCPMCNIEVPVVTGFKNERNQICDNLQSYLKELGRQIVKIEDEFTKNELKGFANLIFESIEKERN